MSDVQLGDLEQRSQREGHQRRLGRLQRVGWAVMALILLASLAGLTGPGPLSWAQASAPLMEVGYERFARQHSDASLQVTLRPDRPGTARLWISDDYLPELGIQQVTPEPDSWTAVEDGVVLAFPVTGGRVDVEIELDLDHIGVLRGAMGVPGRPPARFWQFIYP